MDSRKKSFKLTPMMQQYLAIKKDYQDAILFFRMGDFYEMFLEDAKTASKILEIALTSRSKEKNAPPMCGVPYHAADHYIAKLIKQGRKVAICEQIEDPSLAKGIVKREVTRVVTPGTILDETLLDAKANNYIMSLLPEAEAIGAAFMDLSTGDFFTMEMTGKDRWPRFVNEMERLSPREMIYPDHLSKGRLPLPENAGPVPQVKTPLEDWIFSPEYGGKILLEHFRTRSLDGLGLGDAPDAVRAAGALLHYLKETQKSDLQHITGISHVSSGDSLMLDIATRKNLEIEKSLTGGKQASLWGILDHTRTAMGGRMLRSWLLKPLLSIETIHRRLDAVEELAGDEIVRGEMRILLGEIHDIERLTGKITLATANARDLLALKNSLARLPDLRGKLQDCRTAAIRMLYDSLDEMQDIHELLETSVAEDPPLTIKDGGIIREAYDPEVDELRKISVSGKGYIASLEKKEKQRTGIHSLKVRYNRVFGYYIEVSKVHLKKVPEDYLRKQTLVNAERFITPELKEYEAKVLNAEERIKDLEYKIFCRIREKIAGETPRLQRSARILAELDAFSSLAEAARKYHYVRPSIDDSGEIVIKDGRHPVVELLQPEERFIPNDVFLDTRENRLLIITGPNMGGKSTYLRQVALIVLMAQLGSFVPAKEARIGLVDRIFTRVGASDNLVMGQSTFMVEMTETAQILNSATPRSLIILDEIGRGTSTFDGLSIAWAVAEFILRQPGLSSKTLFATHFFELTDLEKTHPNVRNFHISVREWNDEIIFLHKVCQGRTDKSYGIQVARLAGLPPDVIDRAKEILANLEKGELNPRGKPRIAMRRDEENDLRSEQLQLFEQEDKRNPLLEEIRKLDTANMTPLEALNYLHKIQKRMK